MATAQQWQRNTDSLGWSSESGGAGDCLTAAMQHLSTTMGDYSLGWLVGVVSRSLLSGVGGGRENWLAA